MIFILCLLLQISILSADVDDAQNEQIMMDDTDNTIVSVTVEVEPDELTTEEYVIVESTTPELTQFTSEEGVSDFEEDVADELANNNLSSEETVISTDAQDENTQLTADKATATEDQTDEQDKTKTSDNTFQLKQQEDKNTNEQEDTSANDILYISPAFKATQIDTQKSGLCVQTTSLAKTSDDNIYPKKITVINAITPKKTAYSHWTGTYEPEFTMTVDGQRVGMSCKEHIELNSATMSVAYHAQFPAQRSSEDSIVVTVEKSTQTVAVDFDWHAEPRLRITQSS